MRGASSSENQVGKKLPCVTSIVVFLVLLIKSLFFLYVGKGVKTIIEMVQSTRLDCALGSAGAARRALQLALNHAVSNLFNYLNQIPICSHSHYFDHL